MGKQRTVSEDVLQLSTTETTAGTGAERRNSQTAKSLELWVDVTAASGSSPTLEMIIETSLDGINFVEQARTAVIAAAGAFALAISRVDDALGLFVRTRWEIGGGTPSFTFSAKLLRME